MLGPPLPLPQNQGQTEAMTSSQSRISPWPPPTRRRASARCSTRPRLPDAVKLTVGEPDFNTPEHIRPPESARSRTTTPIRRQRRHPRTAAGDRPEVLGSGTASRPKTSWSPFGAMEALTRPRRHHLPGDEVIPDPSFPNYRARCNARRGGMSVPTEDNDFKLAPRMSAPRSRTDCADHQQSVESRAR